MTSILLALFLIQAPVVDPAAILGEADAQNRIGIVRDLLRKFDRSMIEPLVQVGEQDPSPATRRFLVERLGRFPDAAVTAFLERRATTDTDPGVSLLALDQLSAQQARQLLKLFEKRLALARQLGDKATLDALEAEHQRWVSSGRGATLPAFLQQPPPVFEAIPKRKSIRVLAFSDFGTGGEEMKRTAAAIASAHRKRRFDLGITIGDNILSEGVLSPGDERWKANWEERYALLRIPVFAITGNHDWGFADSPAAEILYSNKNLGWRMPALYYTFTAGPVQFFALCTPALSETQLRWLDRELSNSKARWKVVYGHYSIYSNAGHEDTPGYDKILLPVLKNRANIYMSGHDHVMQHLSPEGGVHFIVNGPAGQGIRPAKSGPRTLYAGSFYGYTLLEAGPRGLKISFVDQAGKTQYEAVIAR